MRGLRLPVCRCVDGGETGDEGDGTTGVKADGEGCVPTAVMSSTLLQSTTAGEGRRSCLPLALLIPAEPRTDAAGRRMPWAPLMPPPPLMPADAAAAPDVNNRTPATDRSRLA